MTKRIIDIETERNPNYEHPLNFLSYPHQATATTESGEQATGRGSTRAAAIAQAVSKLKG